VSPRYETLPKIISREAATDVRAGGLRLTPQSNICRPFRAFFLFVDVNPGAHAPGYGSVAALRLMFTAIGSSIA
jgi:hypothetical protein